jgi:copper chaperone CopZ
MSLVLAGCTDAPDGGAAQSITPTVFNASRAPTVGFNVPDMMCEDGCAATVREILARQPGVKDVHVEFEAKRATVAIEEGAFDAQQALAALIDKGFDNSKLGTDDSAAAEAVSDKSEAASQEVPTPQ